LEQVGYRTLWLGSSPGAELDMVDPLLDATDRLIIGTSIVNIWASAPGPVAESFHRLEHKHPGRFILGIGAGHPEATSDYRRPYEALVELRLPGISSVLVRSVPGSRPGIAQGSELRNDRITGRRCVMVIARAVATGLPGSDERVRVAWSRHIASPPVALGIS
jgi:alkanesulfonate monooxygenase SsuD/methylene tetrahydromethanopterin reductase-like flavin-dependent oxidoreductase (luciferase family)